MGRPPRCDNVGVVKKGSWTPEEDIMLVSYVQEHGPGNWRNVPTATGLRRCSKSCRLRWTNYLRPGIKRGNFTDQEEAAIVKLQALLGNKWAAIASYLPERTDNDIKNYWNTHLKKKLKQQLQTETCPNAVSGDGGFSSKHFISRSGQWEKKLQTDINIAKQALNDALSSQKSSPAASQLKSPADHCVSSHTEPSQLACSYPSSTENIARLLKDWVRNPTKSLSTRRSCNNAKSDSTSSTFTSSAESKTGIDMSGAFESLFSFESFDSSNSDFFLTTFPEAASHFEGENKSDLSTQQLTLTMLEGWLFDEVGN